MFEPQLPYPAAALVRNHRRTGGDVQLLRAHMFAQGLRYLDDAEQLLFLHRSAVTTSREWDEWLIESVANLIVSHTDPQDALGNDNADFLIDMLTEDGVIDNAVGLEILLHSMELASDVPHRLTVLALDQLRIALRSGKGAYARNRTAKRAGISKCDIEFVYRILRGSVHGGRMVLSRNEIAVIEAIDAVVMGQTNHPSWSSLTGSISLIDETGETSSEPWLKMVAFEIDEPEAA